MKRLLVDQKDITQVRLEDVASPALREGEARLRLESSAVTANNVTYAAVGFDIGYWKFFPTGIDGMGQVPVWGVAEVVESRSDALAEGTRLYGFFPLAEELVIVPQDDGHGVVLDTAAHRDGLPAVYNRYVAVKAGTPEQDHLRALLQPLLATSYLLFDWLMDNDRFGAEQIIVGSASSKTGLGLCKYLAEPQTRDYRIVGLTSEGNRSFVEGLGACDKVLSYDEIDRIAQVPSVYVDMSGNAEVKLKLHSHLAEVLTHSAAVGTSHWDRFRPQKGLPGPKPQFFFAPSQIAKRREEWGPGEIEKRITAAWKRLAAQAGDWMTVRVHDGMEAVPQVYSDLANGRADPRDGHVIRI
ncbi:hypothetical protein BOO69_07930 [Sulfitobacter alexandrii]|uniref:DUF2855 family protein n=1 Tax=Sulfitobacter alexandrii TaxID=1917485 RepID=A0A1J0WGB2_9RHOB|nr:DUF2855 family protein [Sulfitobacter alexandrii]APE43353.1 hypothetical protein BOO69_07930 [Sulfitobacter alexandrii]